MNQDSLLSGELGKIDGVKIYSSIGPRKRKMLFEIGIHLYPVAVLSAPLSALYVGTPFRFMDAVGLLCGLAAVWVLMEIRESETVKAFAKALEGKHPFEMTKAEEEELKAALKVNLPLQQFPQVRGGAGGGGRGFVPQDVYGGGGAGPDTIIWGGGGGGSAGGGGSLRERIKVG